MTIVEAHAIGGAAPLDRGDGGGDVRGVVVGAGVDLGVMTGGTGGIEGVGRGAVVGAGVEIVG